MVDPTYQKQGIGGALTKWGMDLADELGAEVRKRHLSTLVRVFTMLTKMLQCCLHSSLAGKPLYEKFGFVLQEHTKLKVPEKFADKKKVDALFMRRPAATLSQ
jgi:predicted N-acetyltransferase YhbS